MIADVILNTFGRFNFGSDHQIINFNNTTSTFPVIQYPLKYKRAEIK